MPISRSGRSTIGAPGRQRPLTYPVTVLKPDDDLTANTARAAELLRNGRVLDLRRFTHGFLDTHTAEAASLVRELLG